MTTFNPPRPTVTDDMIRAAAENAAGQVADQRAGNVDDIVNAYRHSMDGYELARELENRHGWSIVRDDIDVLDEVKCGVDRAVRKAEKDWAKAYFIKPPYPNGTVLTKGVIDGVCEHSPARYLVKEHGCTRDKRWLLIKFEDAVLQDKEPA